MAAGENGAAGFKRPKAGLTTTIWLLHGHASFQALQPQDCAEALNKGFNRPVAF